MPTRTDFVGSILKECTYVLVDALSSLKIFSRRTRERELATFDENRRAVRMLTPMRIKTEGTYRGGEGTTPVTTACPEDT